MDSEHFLATALHYRKKPNSSKCFFLTKQKPNHANFVIMEFWYVQDGFHFNVHFNSECLLNQVTAVITSIHYKKKNHKLKTSFVLRHPIACYMTILSKKGQKVRDWEEILISASLMHTKNKLIRIKYIKPIICKIMLRNKLHDWLKGDWLCIKRMFSLRIQMSIKTSISDHRLIKKEKKTRVHLHSIHSMSAKGLAWWGFLNIMNLNAGKKTKGKTIYIKTKT